jgi:hypothetical protein
MVSPGFIAASVLQELRGSDQKVDAGAEQGRFPRLQDRDDLWSLLVVITARKALDLIQHERRKKRGGGRVLTEAELADLASASISIPGLDQLVGQKPTPAFSAQVRRRALHSGAPAHRLKKSSGPKFVSG